MSAVFSSADWGTLRSQYENRVRVHSVAGVCKALQGGQAFKANLDIKITARHNDHCWVVQDSTGRVISDMELLHSAVIGSWPGAAPLSASGVEGIRWDLWGCPKLVVCDDDCSSNTCPIMVCAVDTIWAPAFSFCHVSSKLACIDLYGGVGTNANISVTLEFVSPYPLKVRAAWSRWPRGIHIMKS